MTADQLLDAHTEALRNDPAYQAIWAMVQAEPEHLRLLRSMTIWHGGASRLRAMLNAAMHENGACQQAEMQLQAVHLLAWCIAQFQGESGAGDNYWEQFPQYEAACKLLQSAHSIGILKTKEVTNG